MTCELHAQTWKDCAECLSNIARSIGILSCGCEECSRGGSCGLREIYAGKAPEQSQAMPEVVVVPAPIPLHPRRASKQDWPDPTPEMLEDPLFEAIWQCIKTWDVNVPEQYSGYMGATGNHVRSIVDAVRALRNSQQGWECPRCHIVHAPYIRSCECRP